MIRSGKVIAIPESGTPAHVKENAVALSLTLTPQEGLRRWIRRIRDPPVLISRGKTFAEPYLHTTHAGTVGLRRAGREQSRTRF